ncbi:MAG: oxygen-independent coproporphyrinogen III oxidase [Candidatus Omnitrophica bacterium]|nr:oxygen-independent coproporphyrinogen III oxidase [Candidatus Omnitrophota bacterium]
MSLTIDRETVAKFDVPGPRYTSYPTAPVWSTDVNAAVYAEKLAAFGRSNKTLSLYIHIPFCQSLCTYCGCNVVIRKQDERFGDEYIEYLFREMELVHRAIGNRPRVRQLHWGGGTPTFLNESQIERLYKGTLKYFDVDPAGEIAIEIDPRTIDKSKVRKLRALGFNRVSMGVQDFSEDVQKEVNRWQPYPIVKEFNDWCRELKFASVNFDLIYGLPRQTPESFSATVEKVVALAPERVALYSFAYVPWLKRHQRKIDESLLPSADAKLDIFLRARERFLESGYQAIAMDHFALADDDLAKAFEAGTLYRNFMGYTVKPADEYIGLGVTSIGFLENTYAQNEKALPAYYAALDAGRLPVERGKVLTDDDRARRWAINSLMCRFRIDKRDFQKEFHADFDRYFQDEQAHIRRCVQDGLLRVENGSLEVCGPGKLFVRNVCMGFDHYLQQKDAPARFSRTV